ncbi:MAG: glucose-6-phosphate isomerase [Myxococcales bacterium]|nr:glucose-6-phosphate isomerase [Myxococcales bacterium]
MAIRFDYSHALAAGVAKRDLTALKKDLRQVRKQLQADRAAGRLGFADLPGDAGMLRAVKKAAAAYSHEDVHSVVILGIGGSALGFIALKEALMHPQHNQLAALCGHRTFYVLDNVDPELVAGVLDVIDPRTTLVNVITKSGSTAETIGQFLIFFDLFAKKLGSRAAAVKHFLFTTDPAKGPLRALAEKEGFATLPVPPAVGGRFSIFTPVGLFPAALAGMDIKALLQGAGDALQTSLYGLADASPALLGAGLHYLHYRQGRVMAVMMPYSNALFRVADWFRQLWAESLGKAVDLSGKPVHVGPTPVAALGATDQHSQVQLYAEGPDDKFYTFLRVERLRRKLPYPASPWKDGAFTYFKGHSMYDLFDAEAEATRFALSEVGRPCATITLPRIDEDALGRLLMHLEVQTAAAGRLFGIDAFDQPGVEAGKRYAFGLLGRAGYEAEAAKVRRAAGKQIVVEG